MYSPAGSQHHCSLFWFFLGGDCWLPFVRYYYAAVMTQSLVNKSGNWAPNYLQTPKTDGRAIVASIAFSRCRISNHWNTICFFIEKCCRLKLLLWELGAAVDWTYLWNERRLKFVFDTTQQWTRSVNLTGYDTMSNLWFDACSIQLLACPSMWGYHFALLRYLLIHEETPSRGSDTVGRGWRSHSSKDGKPKCSGKNETIHTFALWWQISAARWSEGMRRTSCLSCTVRWSAQGILPVRCLFKMYRLDGVRSACDGPLSGPERVNIMTYTQLFV